MTQRTPAGRPTAPTLPVPAALSGNEHLAVIVPHEEGERLSSAMETCLQACSTEEPFALELVGTTREQRFVLRACSHAQLVFLCKQLEAQYPQAEILHLPASSDPLLLHAGEHAVVGSFAL